MLRLPRKLLSDNFLLVILYYLNHQRGTIDAYLTGSLQLIQVSLFISLYYTI